MCRLLGPRLEPSGAIVSSTCPAYVTACQCTFSASSRRCHLSGGAEKRTAGIMAPLRLEPVDRSRRRGGRQQQVGVSATRQDASFRSRRGRSSGRSIGYLQNTQKEMRLLLLQWKNDCVSPCDLTSYWIPTSMAVNWMESMGASDAYQMRPLLGLCGRPTPHGALSHRGRKGYILVCLRKSLSLTAEQRDGGIQESPISHGLMATSLLCLHWVLPAPPPACSSPSFLSPAEWSSSSTKVFLHPIRTPPILVYLRQGAAVRHHLARDAPSYCLILHSTTACLPASLRMVCRSRLWACCHRYSERHHWLCPMPGIGMAPLVDL
jgi:hypothetical protein